MGMPTALRWSRAAPRRGVHHPSPRRPRVSVQGYGRTYTYAISKRTFENLVEDLEALSSPKYLASIRRARRDIARGRTYTIEEVKRELGIR